MPGEYLSHVRLVGLLGRLLLVAALREAAFLGTLVRFFFQADCLATNPSRLISSLCTLSNAPS